MKLLFLGVSSALSVGYKNFHSNILFETAHGNLLIDCGCDIRHSLFELGYGSVDINGVYISHLHSDHVGGLEWLAFSNLFVHKRQLPLYISNDQRNRLWNNVLLGGFSTLEDRESSLDVFFEISEIHKNIFMWGDAICEMVPVEHSYSNNVLVPSYGLFIRHDSSKIFITTDTRFTPDKLNYFYEQADIIFHDCETSNYRSNQHAHYNDLKTLDKKIKGKMWLYDYNMGELPDAVADGFLGFVQRGQEFIF